MSEPSYLAVTPLLSPSPCLSFSPLCVSEIHTYSLAQKRESVTMETRRRDSKSYLLRRELRQQKGVHCVSGRERVLYTASEPPPPPYLKMHTLSSSCSVRPIYPHLTDFSQIICLFPHNKMHSKTPSQFM